MDLADGANDRDLMREKVESHEEISGFFVEIIWQNSKTLQE